MVYMTWNLQSLFFLTPTYWQVHFSIPEWLSTSCLILVWVAKCDVIEGGAKRFEDKLEVKEGGAKYTKGFNGAVPFTDKNSR